MDASATVEITGTLSAPAALPSKGASGENRADLDAARHSAEAARQAVGLANAGQVEESLPIFRGVFREDRRWVEVTRRLQPGVVPPGPKGDELIQRIVAEAKR